MVINTAVKTKSGVWKKPLLFHVKQHAFGIANKCHSWFHCETPPCTPLPGEARFCCSDLLCAATPHETSKLTELFV